MQEIRDGSEHDLDDPPSTTAPRSDPGERFAARLVLAVAGLLFVLLFAALCLVLQDLWVAVNALLQR